MVEVFRDQFHVEVIGGNDWVARVVGFGDLGKEVNGRGVWRAENKVRGGRRKTEGGDEIVDHGGHSLLVARHEVGGQRAIEGSVLKLVESFSRVCVYTYIYSAHTLTYPHEYTHFFRSNS